jgi:hypothetical protein
MIDEGTYQRVASAIERRLGKGPVRVTPMGGLAGGVGAVNHWHVQVVMPDLSSSLHEVGTAEDFDLEEALAPGDDDMSEALRQEALADLRAGDADRATSILMLLLEDRFAMHDRRVEACRTLGLPIMGARDHGMTHASVDAWVLGELERRHGLSPLAVAGRLRGALADEMRSFQIAGWREGAPHHQTRYQFHLAFRGGVDHPVFVPLHVEMSDAVVFNGERLRVSNMRPPDTLLDKMVGRPLGELVEGLGDLGRRVMRRWRDDDDGFVALVDAEPIRMGGVA